MMRLSYIRNKLSVLLNDPARLRGFLLRRIGVRVPPPVPEFPPMVMIDTTTRCNLKCSHCPHSVLQRDPSFIGDMDPGLYRKIIDEVAFYPDTVVRPFDGGEPLMRKDIAELIAYSKEKGIKRVSINSNGILLGERIRRELVCAGLDHMEVSIDAATAETYLAVRKSRLFDRAVKNTVEFQKMMKQAGPGRGVTVSFVLQKKNIHEMDAFRDFWKDKVDKVFIREYHQHNALVDNNERAVDHNITSRHPCPYLWDRIIIFHDGRVRFCESDWKAEHAIGDIRRQTIKEIWHGKTYRKLRESHVRGTFDSPNCLGCTDWKEVRWF